MRDEAETVKGFCYLGDRLNASGGCEAALTAITRVGWKKFRERGEILFGKKFFLRMKGKMYKIYVRSAMLYGSETWCLRENEIAILRRAERSLVRAVCGVKLVDKTNTEELMNMLGLKEAADKLARANGMRWYGHILRRPEEDVLVKAMVHEMVGKRKQGRPRMKWREQIEGNMRRIGLKKEVAADRCRWKKGVRRVVKVVGCIRPPPVTEN